MKLRPTLSRLLTLALTLTLLPPIPARTAPTQDVEKSVEVSAEDGLRFRLSEGADEPVERPTPHTVAPATPLSEADASKLLARLPTIKPDASDTLDFKIRARSLPPRAGETIRAAFALPVTDAPPTPAKTTAPLEVTRFAPVGEVELAPALSITFSQPMVVVSSQEEAAASVPVKLTPQPAGTWRWLGAQTLVFQPEAEGGRLPMATDYTVTIPAGTTSALGNALAQTTTFNFSTSPPTLKSSSPSGTAQRRDALMFLEFDGRIDAARVLEHIKLQPAVGDARLRLATPEEIAADESIKNLVKASQEGRWLVLRAVRGPGSSTKDALPGDTNIKIIIPPGTPSTEGPRVTINEQSFTFKTYGPLRVTGTECGYEKRCAPLDRLQLGFSNPLDQNDPPASHVQIKPDIPGAKINVSGDSIQIEGAKRSNTLYTVTLDRSIKDVFGQTLAGENQFTFKVTTAFPRLFVTGDGFVVLDPAGTRAFTVYSINYDQLKVSLYRVAPEDWPRFRAYQAWRQFRDNQPPRVNDKVKETVVPPPGQLVFDKIVEVKAAPDELTESLIDLSPALTDGYGQVFVKVEPIEREEDKKGPITVYAYRQRNRAEAWVQSTDIGLDAFTDNDQFVAWASALKDGAPLAGVEVTASPDTLSGVTDDGGLARFAFKDLVNNKARQIPLLVARRGADVAILPQTYNNYYYSNDERSSWRNSDAREKIKWYVFDDRQLYRPGEEVSVKGWIRKINLTPAGSTELFVPEAGGETVNYTLKDSEDNEILKGAAKLNPLAGFDLKLHLPATMNLGNASLEFVIGENGDKYTHAFQVQEFRRPEFEITARTSEAPHFIGSFATATMNAKYYAGGGLAGTDVEWTVTSVPTNYTPPNRDDYTFGKFYAWWRGDAREDGEEKEETFKGRTDAEGKHTLRMDFDGVNPPRPSSVTAEARVQDVNRQTLAATTTLLVHPSEIYVGLKSARTFVQKGEAFDISTIVTDLDGKALAGRDIQLRLVQLEYVNEGGEWKQEEHAAQEQTVKSGTDAVRVRLATKEGGTYRLTARVRDDRERPNESELSLWVAGGKLPPQREVKQETVELVPDRKNYKGGEVAEILVQSPFAPAEGVMTLRRSGLLRTERFTMRESSYTLRVPLEEALTPNVRVQVDLVGAAQRTDDESNVLSNLPLRPAYASGKINLVIPPDTRRLSVTARPRDAVLEPGAETLVDVEVKDAGGRAVRGTDTAVVVVDESILALANYKLADPLSVFYEERDADVTDYHLREKVKLANPREVERLVSSGILTTRQIESLPVVGRNYVNFALLSSGVAADGAMLETTQAQLSTNRALIDVITKSGTNEQGADDSQIQLRRNFNALAVFAASLPTDANGHAQVKIKLPDNLTRYRVVAISVAGGKYAGTAESVITARRPLMVRPSAPRFLNYGDRAELPVVLQNQTDRAMSVEVAVRATNAELTNGAGRRVSVPANDRVEVRFPVAALKPGTARFQFAAAAGDKADAAEVSLPVYTPATTEAFATYGVIDEGAVAQPVRAPADAVKTFGGLEVTTASTQLQELTDAVIYLVRYPYECSEQISSRVLALAALKDVLTAFHTKDLPSPDEMRASVSTDLKRLQGLQNEDGGFGFWQRGEVSNPYVSVHVAHALVRAQGKGFDVPAQVLEESQGYLSDIEKKIPGHYGIESRRAIEAYALFVRNLMKDRDAGRARKLIAGAGGGEHLSLESLGWLLPVLSGDTASATQVAAIRRHLNNRVTETAGAAHFADDYKDGAYTILYSDRRADGVLLDALIGDQPQSDIIPKLVRGLLGGRKRGHWENTQENVFILLALDRYFNTYEKTTPDFVARVWLGEGFAGEQIFRGRSVDRQQLELPMSALIERTANAPANLTISKTGAGRLYFRVGTQYAPSNLKLAAADYGFRVARRYEAIDEPADVRRDADGVWHIKAGARVRVRLSMSNPARRYHVALVDPLPAGLETLNPELATTERVPAASTEAGVARGGSGFSDFYWYWRGTWYEHQNLRDERAEAFTSLLWEGEHEYSYFARATTPGFFVVPPTKAEEMYAPETFGRAASDRVRVE